MRTTLLIITIVATVLVPSAVTAQEDPLPPGGSFYDDNGSIHEPNIEAIAAAGITFGCNPPFNSKYCPDGRVTRGEMAAFLTRALALPPSAEDRFTDDDDSVFEADIEAIATAGITLGCNPPTNDQFCPETSINRMQFASMLVRALDLPPSVEDRFVDDDDLLHETDIQALAAAGVTLGCNPPTNDQFCPTEPVTRAQMASFLTRALDLDPIVPPPPPPPPGSVSCLTGAHAPNGNLAIVPGATDPVASGSVWKVRFEVEEGLGVDPACFAAEALRILNDPRGWGADGAVTFRQVDDAAFTIRVILASPAKVDQLCAPLNTGGIFSCRNGNTVNLNSWRWEFGATPFGSDTTTYRQYLVNHEVGHALGHGHRGCTGSGDPAPVMQQQTKFTSPCVPNGWPLSFER